MTRAGGVNSAVPVAPRREAFDVDLGPDGNGSTVAVYSRCKREADAVGCNLYQFDFAAGRESKLSTQSTHGSEYEPTVWEKNVAYIVNGGSCRGRIECIYVQSLSGGRARRLSGGPKHYIGKGKNAGVPGPTGLELRERSLAFSWVSFGRYIVPARSHMLIDTLGGRQRIVRLADSGIHYRTLYSPSFKGHYLYFVLNVQHHGDDFESHIFYRYDLRSGQTARTRETTPAYFSSPGSAVWTGAGFALTGPDKACDCNALADTGAVSFDQ
jgi:hypothetical protein